MAGRPRAFDEDAALDDLVRLFWRRGYDQVSQQQMVQATGLSTSSLYSAFGTKSQTFERVLRRYRVLADELMYPLRCGHAGTADLLTFIDRFRAQLEGATGACGCLVVTSMTARSDCGHLAGQLVAEHLSSRRAAFLSALERAHGLGESVPDPVATSALLSATTFGIFATARATAAGPEAHEQLAAMEQLVKTWRHRTP